MIGSRFDGACRRDATTPRVYSWALRREKVAKRENIRMADCMIFPECILASNVPASW